MVEVVEICEDGTEECLAQFMELETRDDSDLPLPAASSSPVVRLLNCKPVAATARALSDGATRFEPALRRGKSGNSIIIELPNASSSESSREREPTGRQLLADPLRSSFHLTKPRSQTAIVRRTATPLAESLKESILKQAEASAMSDNEAVSRADYKPEKEGASVATPMKRSASRCTSDTGVVDHRLSTSIDSTSAGGEAESPPKRCRLNGNVLRGVAASSSSPQANPPPPHPSPVGERPPSSGLFKRKDRDHNALPRIERAMDRLLLESPPAKAQRKFLASATPMARSDSGYYRDGWVGAKRAEGMQGMFADLPVSPRSQTV